MLLGQSLFVSFFIFKKIFQKYLILAIIFRLAGVSKSKIANEFKQIIDTNDPEIWTSLSLYQNKNLVCSNDELIGRFIEAMVPLDCSAFTWYNFKFDHFWYGSQRPNLHSTMSIFEK